MMTYRAFSTSAPVFRAPSVKGLKFYVIAIKHHAVRCETDVHIHTMTY